MSSSVANFTSGRSSIFFSLIPDASLDGRGRFVLNELDRRALAARAVPDTGHLGAPAFQIANLAKPLAVKAADGCGELSFQRVCGHESCSPRARLAIRML